MRESTGTTWPSGLQTMFDICRNEQLQRDPPEMRYYGPYNDLFLWCFCSDTLPDFVVAPSSPPLSFLSLPDIDFPDVCFVVTDFHLHPVLVAEVKNGPIKLTYALGRTTICVGGSMLYFRIAVSPVCTG